MFSIHARKTTIPLVLCTFFIFASFVSDHYSGDFRDTLRGAVDRREEIGNSSAASDFYGLGMRLGLYFQGLGMILLAGQPNKRCGTGLKLVGGGIGLAMLSSWTIFARQKLFSPCEAALILFLISTAIIPAELSLFKPIAIPGEGLGVLLLVTVKLWLHISYFWTFAELYRTLPRLGTPNRIFFFANVSINGWFRKLMLAQLSLALLHVPSLVYIGYGLGGIALKSWLERTTELSDHDKREFHYRSKKYNNIRGKLDAIANITKGLMPTLRLSDTQWLTPDEMDSPLPSTLQKRLTAIPGAMIMDIVGLPLISFGFTIAMVEKTIAWNHLSPVTDLQSPGQLIPLVTAIAILFNGIVPVFRTCCLSSTDDFSEHEEAPGRQHRGSSEAGDVEMEDTAGKQDESRRERERVSDEISEGSRRNVEAGVIPKRGSVEIQEV